MKLLRDRFDILLEKAKSGNAKSQYRLAKSLSKGFLVEKNPEAAKYWAFKSVNAGYMKAGKLLSGL